MPTDQVEFIVRIDLDPEGDGTVPTEQAVSEAVFDRLWETYPIVEVEAVTHERRRPVEPLGVRLEPYSLFGPE